MFLSQLSCSQESASSRGAELQHVKLVAASLEIKRRTKNRYDMLDGISLLRDGTVRSDDLIGPIDAHYKLKSRV